MRRNRTLGFALAIHVCLLAPPGRAEREGSTAAARAGQGGLSRPASVEPTRAFGTRDINTFNSQKLNARPQRTNSPAGHTALTQEKTARAAVFATGVRGYYPAVRPNQSRNSNVIDPRTLCVPGRRALLQR